LSECWRRSSVPDGYQLSDHLSKSAISRRQRKELRCRVTAPQRPPFQSRCCYPEYVCLSMNSAASAYGRVCIQNTSVKLPDRWALRGHFGELQSMEALATPAGTSPFAKRHVANCLAFALKGEKASKKEAKAARKKNGHMAVIVAQIPGRPLVAQRLAKPTVHNTLFLVVVLASSPYHCSCDSSQQTVQISSPQSQPSGCILRFGVKKLRSRYVGAGLRSLGWAASVAVGVKPRDWSLLTTPQLPASHTLDQKFSSYAQTSTLYITFTFETRRSSTHFALLATHFFPNSRSHVRNHGQALTKQPEQLLPHPTRPSLRVAKAISTAAAPSLVHSICFTTRTITCCSIDRAPSSHAPSKTSLSPSSTSHDTTILFFVFLPYSLLIYTLGADADHEHHYQEPEVSSSR
jgi:hypothetical protein